MARALIVVDVQRDFCEGGSLAVRGGGATAARITGHIEAHAGAYALVVASRDWHIAPGSHFAAEGEAPDYVETWPVHCVAGSEGAEWHPHLHLPGDAEVVLKGQEAASFSAFEGRTEGAGGGGSGESLGDLLRRHHIDAVDVVGIATSFCVRQTALDAVREGFATRVLAGLTADVDPAATPKTLQELAAAGVEVTD